MMKNKLILTVALSLTVGVCGGMLAACSDTSTPEHEHSYTVWDYTDTQHWKKCADDGATGPKSAHSFVNGTCECGYKDPNAAVEKEILLSWTGTYCTLDFYNDCTYEFCYSGMNVKENGTWAYQNWELSLTTKKNNKIVAVLSEEPEYKFTLLYVADINEQLKDTFTLERSVWGAKLNGLTGTYTPPTTTTTPESPETPTEDVTYGGTMNNTSYTITAKTDSTCELSLYNTTGHYVVVGNALVLYGYISGVEQVWNNLPKINTIGENNTLTTGATVPGKMNDTPLSFTLNADGTASVGVTGVSIECNYALNGLNVILSEKDGVTMNEGQKTFWNRLPKLWNITEDGVVAGGVVSATFNNSPLTISLAADGSATIEVSGMQVKCAYNFADGTLTLTANDDTPTEGGTVQIWNNVPKTWAVSDGVGTVPAEEAAE